MDIFQVVFLFRNLGGIIMMIRYVRKDVFGNLIPGELYDGYVSVGPIYISVFYFIGEKRYFTAFRSRESFDRWFEIVTDCPKTDDAQKENCNERKN